MSSEETMDQQITFKSSTLRFVCISDTHNDDPRHHVPDGDILLHAGDMTDFGTVDEMRAAVDWIASLPHPLKIIVAGNHDMGLDKAHPSYSLEVQALLTSPESRKAGIRYLDREVSTVCHFTSSSKNGTSTVTPLRIYANPMQPEFLGKPYAFIYPPAPSPQATAAWETASTLTGRDSEAVDIWLMHSPPFGRLDRVPVPGLTGCRVQMDKIAAARPRLCVFGHYHYSWGVERVQWRQEGERPDDDAQQESGSDHHTHGAIAEVRLLTASPERQEAEGFTVPVKSQFDFTGAGEEEELVRGRDTVFVNAGWMTMKKNAIDYRNPPFVITLSLE